MEKERGISITNVGHIGHHDIFGTTAAIRESLRKDKSIDVVVVPQEEYDDSFLLNDVKYIPIKKEPKTLNKNMSKMASMAMMASMMYAPILNSLYGGSNYTRKLPENIDVIKEYGLIQLKQSKLSKWERDEVIFIFEKNFTRVNP